VTAGGAGVQAGLKSGDGPLSVRARPSSLKLDLARRTPSTGGKCLVNVHATSRLTPETAADTPVRSHRAGASLPGPDAGHPLHGARRHRAASCGNRQPSSRASHDGSKPPVTAGDDAHARALHDASDAGEHDGSKPVPAAGGRRVAWIRTRRVGRRGKRRLAAGIGGPRPAERPRPGEQVIQPVPRRHAQQGEDPPAHRSGLGPDHPAGQRIQRPHPAHQRLGLPRPGHQLAATVIQDHSHACSGPSSPRRPPTSMPGRHPNPRRAQRQHRRQRLRRGRQRPPVVPGKPGDQRRVANLAAVIRVIPVQPRLTRIRRIRIRQPQRPARPHRPPGRPRAGTGAGPDGSAPNSTPHPAAPAPGWASRTTRTPASRPGTPTPTPANTCPRPGDHFGTTRHARGRTIRM